MKPKFTWEVNVWGYDEDDNGYHLYNQRIYNPNDIWDEVERFLSEEHNRVVTVTLITSVGDYRVSKEYTVTWPEGEDSVMEIELQLTEVQNTNFP